MPVTNKLIPIPFARDATAEYKNDIPDEVTASDTNRASYVAGFPPLTFVTKAAGGKPPRGSDFNGLFNTITTAISYMQTGMPQAYNSDFATVIGGYPLGSILLGSDGMLYQSTIDGNTSDPIGLDGWSYFVDGKYLPATKSGATYTVTAQTEFKKTPTVNGSNVLTEETSTGRLLNIIKFETSGTYTPSTGTKFIIVEAVGGGAAGGGCSTSSTSQDSIGSGGGAGGYGKSKILKSEISSSVSVIIGAGGIGVSGANGGNGGNTSFGSLISCGGGKGGGKGGPAGSSFGVEGGGGGSVSGGSIITIDGSKGTAGFNVYQALTIPGSGGNSFFGSGTTTAGNRSGIDAVNYGSGGSGSAVAGGATGAYKGGNGYQGVVIIWEYA